MKEKKKMTKSKIYMIIGICVLVLAIGGSTYAYYAASKTAELSGYAAGAGMEITVNKLSNAADKDLVPLYNAPEMLTKAAKGNGNTGSTFNASKSCIDKNGNTACQVYEIILTNTGNAPLTVNGGVSLIGTNTPNLDCAVMDSNISVTNNNSCKGKTTLANNETINAGASNTYYIIVYINNTGEVQTDTGNFSGTITFTSTAGGKLKAKFAEDGVNAVEYVNNLYADSSKTPIIHAGETTDDIPDQINYSSKTNNNVATQMSYEGDTVSKVIPITSSNILYQYDVNDSLMNDNYGNIRYFGANPNNYADVGDTYKEDVEIGNWVQAFGVSQEEIESQLGIVDSISCLSYMQDNEATDQMVQEMFGMTINEFCSTTTIHKAGDPILWRIVGIFDGKLKLVRDESIGNYSWDTSDSSIDEGYGVNEWSQADLMKLLNPGYESETVGGSLFWNSLSGNCYNYYDNGYTNCDFTSTGLSNNARSMIDSTIWYTGGIHTSFVNYPTAIMVKERGANVISDPDDGIQRQTTWTGKVGLLYASDYGYAQDFRYCHEYLRDYDTDGCYNNNWLFKAKYYALLTPDSEWNYTWYIDGFGSLYGGNRPGQSLLHIYPTVYLNSNVVVTGGTGFEEDPYILSLE